MRIQPLQGSDLRQVEPVLWAAEQSTPIAKRSNLSRATIEPTNHDTAASNSNGTRGEQWLYELRPAQPLPTVDLARTTASTLLSLRAYDRLEAAMPAIAPILVFIFCVAAICFIGLLVVSAATMRPWVPLIFIITLPKVMAVAAFLSLDMLALLLHSYEFWFISALNTLNWVGLALIFGDVRAIVCVGVCFNAQSVVAIDANYRMYPIMAKGVVMAGPAMLTLTVCCAYRLVAVSSYPTLELGGLAFHSRQVVIFTSSTLALFIVKKAYFKYRRMGVRPDTGESGVDTPRHRHIIPCVVLQARLRLDPVAIQPRLTVNQDNASPRVANILEATGATPPPDVASAPQIQQLRLSNDKAFVVDVRRTVVRRLLDLVNSYYQMTTALSFFGIFGLLATIAVWVLLLQHDQSKVVEELTLRMGVVAAASTMLFTSATVALAQRDLLRLLVWNFDVVFSTLQGTVLAVCLLDLLRWRAASSLAVISWWLWFHWLLVLDALTPSVAHQLRIRKHLALPAILLVLVVAFVCALELLVGSSTVFSPRLLWSLRVTSFGDFDLHTDTLAVQRVVTIVGWSSRLVIDFAMGDPDQLVYIRRHVEYVSPYATF